MAFKIGRRRAKFIDITKKMGKKEWISAEDKQNFENFDTVYRALCAMLYNYVPMSGHPGGSISSGRFVSGLLFNCMDYDISNPDREDADIISYAAGHKAMGLYAFWALRNEAIRIGAPGLLPKDENQQIRFEDLLGFRKNPATKTPLFSKFNSKPLDGHPTPATPFVRLSTGASGVGLGASIGMAFGAMDYYGKNAPYVHIIEGEGGLTPGRVSEALAAAGTSSLKNVILHIDWNQSSIDSNHVCREGETPGDYVQWDPTELTYFHDWNTIFVPNGFDFSQIFAAQKTALSMKNSQPTAIVYRTTKGWKYGIEGKASHGAGHSLCSDGFYKSIISALDKVFMPCCENSQRCEGGKDKAMLEECFWKGLQTIRSILEKDKPTIDTLVKKLTDSKTRLNKKGLKPRSNAPEIEFIFETAAKAEGKIPDELVLETGKVTTLRAELGKVLNYYNKTGKGSIFTASADLLGSTSVNIIAKGFPEGYYNADKNPEARLLSTGGICEDGMSAIISGISNYGHHIGVGSSYGAFIAPLGHIASRLHAIGNQAKKGSYKPMILVCAHAGVKTGEDGPTHADPQALQVFQENFPVGTLITLTPWDPQEIWTLVSAALAKRPAVIVPFVTRPNEKILDRKALGLAPTTEAASGVYLLHKAENKSNGTVVIQGSEVAYAFVEKTLPLLKKEGKDVDAYYVSSAELFDLLPQTEQEKIYPEAKAQEAMGITGFTMPTMDRWIHSEHGRKSTLHPFKKGHYLGSGQAEQVLEESGLDSESQLEAILKHIKEKP